MNNKDRQNKNELIKQEETQALIAKHPNEIVNIADTNYFVQDDNLIELKEGKELEKSLMDSEIVGRNYKQEGLDFSDDKIYARDKDNVLLFTSDKFDNFPDLSKLNNEERSLVVNNFYDSLKYVTKKKLEYNDLPFPLAGIINQRLILSFIILTLVLVGYFVDFLNWPWLVLAGILILSQLFSLVYTYYLAKTRNFRMFSGVVVQNIDTFRFIPSLKRRYVQISDGKRFLNFQVRYNDDSFKEGMPVTVYMSVFDTLEETKYGPLIEKPLAISKGVEVSAVDEEGNFKDGKVKDRKVDDFFRS